MGRTLDKKKGVTFQLVHRSQQDPLIADECAPQRVLIPVDRKEIKKEQDKHESSDNDNCTFSGNLKLPSSVFPSKVEDEVGMLGKAAPVSGPQLHLDPDIVAAMDEDFDYSDPENELEDNFVELADGLVLDRQSNYDEDDDENAYLNDELLDEITSMDGSFANEETKSRFTDYSMTSSVIKRNEQLTFLDEKFEKMFADYTENEIGALDSEEIEGHVPQSADILLQYANEFGNAQRKEYLEKPQIKDKIKESLLINSEDELVTIPVYEKDKWNCESILSTYSSLYNHPKLITESQKNKIQVDKRTGIPKQVLSSQKLTKKLLSKLDEQKESTEPTKKSIIPDVSTLSIRDKHETPEQRKDRKRLLKEYRKERRLEKKLNAEAFKEEEKKQTKITINNKNNIQGNKIF